MKKSIKALAICMALTQVVGCASTETVKTPVDVEVKETITHETSVKETESTENKNETEESKVEESKVEESEVEESEVEETGNEIEVSNKDKYSINLYNSLVNKEENWAFSPYSITDCFSLIYNGADGQSKKELYTILGFSDRKTDFYRTYDSQVKYYNDKGVKVANKGYLNNKYINDVDTSLLGTNNIDTIEMNNESAKIMNEFIESNTENKIKNLIPNEAIKDDTVMVLINALYFKKSWNFEERTINWTDGTKYKGFGEELGTRSVKEVTPDIDVLKLNYSEDEDWDEIYEIDDNDKMQEEMDKYDKHRYSMYIICNNVNSTEEKVDEYMNSLTPEELDKVLDFSEHTGLDGYTDVEFKVPNFEVDYKGSIKDSLQNMGLQAPFNSETDDFSKLGPVYINDVLHGTYVKVDEKGTEAAAATAMIMMETTAMIEPPKKVIKEVVADETFAFIIKDDTNNNILFMGRIVKPSEQR